jgi:hypothetical protein
MSDKQYEDLPAALDLMARRFCSSHAAARQLVVETMRLGERELQPARRAEAKSILFKIMRHIFLARSL